MTITKRLYFGRLALGETAGGLAFMALSFLAGPFGLTAPAHRLIRKSHDLSDALKHFIFDRF